MTDTMKSAISRRQVSSRQVSSRQVSRRQVLQGAGALAVAAPFISNRAMAADSIVFCGYGGSNQEFQSRAWIEPFEKETGVKVVQATGIDLARLKAMVSLGNVEWDVVNLSGVYAHTAEAAGLLEPLDLNIVDVSDMLVQPTKGILPTYSYYGGIAYNTSRVPTGKNATNWKDFWDVAQYPGKRSLRFEAYENFEMALLADGVAPKDLYPLDVDRAFKVLDKLKPHVLKWGNSQDAVTLLQRNEVAYSYAYGGRVFSMNDAGVPLEIVRRSNVVSPSSFCATKGTKKRELAMKFLNYCVRADRQAHFCEVGAGYSPTKRGALAQLTPKTLAQQAVVDDPGSFVLDLSYWAANYDKHTIRFKEWMLL